MSTQFARHAGNEYPGFEGRSFTMADYFYWMDRGYCVVCLGPLVWDAEEEDTICDCMRPSDEL